DRSRQAGIATETEVLMSSLSQQVPTNEEYKQHEIDKKWSYLPVLVADIAHGAPLASIRRAFAALGSPRFFLIVDLRIRNMLEELRRLYFSDDDLPTEQAALRVVYRPQAETSQKHQLVDSSDVETGRAVKKAKGETTGQTASQPAGQAGVPGSTELCRAYTEWVLGPGLTSNDAVRRYAPVFSAT
ncbi:hypothetical protein N7461_004678, partial [Penicillium sp. DV-2018c]